CPWLALFLTFALCAAPCVGVCAPFSQNSNSASRVPFDDLSEEELRAEHRLHQRSQGKVLTWRRKSRTDLTQPQIVRCHLKRAQLGAVTDPQRRRFIIGAPILI